jgi:hypothetical protein
MKYLAYRVVNIVDGRTPGAVICRPFTQEEFDAALPLMGTSVCAGPKTIETKTERVPWKTALEVLGIE